MLKKTLVAIAVWCSVALIGLSASQAQGQPAGQARTGGIVAVLDLAKVFESHPGHKAKMQAIEARAEEMKKSFQEQQVALQEKAKNAAQQYQGAQLDAIEIQLRQEEASLQTRARQAQTELMKSEAEAFFETHTEIMGIVTTLCQKFDVAVVLRHDSEPIDPSRPETVIRGVQRSVVFASNDLTPHVLHEINQTSTASAAGGAVGAGGATRTR
jgi:outer membrane protein